MVERRGCEKGIRSTGGDLLYKFSFLGHLDFLESRTLDDYTLHNIALGEAYECLRSPGLPGSKKGTLDK